jgi:Na+-driven multidrug efflux pump
VTFPKLTLFGLFDCQRRWLNGFGKNYVPLMCTALSVPFHFFWCYLFAIYLNMGLSGIGLAGAISFGLQLIFINLYTYHSKDVKLNVSICDPRIYQKDELI